MVRGYEAEVLRVKGVAMHFSMYWEYKCLHAMRGAGPGDTLLSQTDNCPGPQRAHRQLSNDYTAWQVLGKCGSACWSLSNIQTPQVLLPCPGQIQTVKNMADGGQQVPDSLLLSREQNLGGPIDDTVPGSAGPVRGQDLCRPPQGAGPNFMRLKMKADR